MLIYYLLTVVHVLVCLILILVVLLQSGKGADLAGAFGGGATQTAFGSRGPASFLSKMTTVAAVVFMFTSIALSTVTRKVDSKSIMDTTAGKAQPAAKLPVKQPPVQAPTPEQIKRRVEDLEAKQPPQQAPGPNVKVVPGATTTATQGTAKPAESNPPAKESKPPVKH